MSNPTEEFINLVVESYQTTRSLNKTAKLLAREHQIDIAYQKVRKILITAGVYENPTSREVNRLFAEGNTVEEIARRLHMSKISVHGYLPYQKGIYQGPERSKDALRSERYRRRKASKKAAEAVLVITVDNLWEVITSRQGETFYTKKMLPFTYTVKGGEMFTDRRQRSITKSTFEWAFEKLQNAPDTVTGPKALNVYGAPYVWAVLHGIGVIP